MGSNIGREDLRELRETASIGVALVASTLVGGQKHGTGYALFRFNCSGFARWAGVWGFALVLLLGCASEPAAGPERIVLITVDTLRADHLGCYGAASAHTPHLDTLAARGVRFEAALSPAPLTLPAHASLMTGVDPPQHGVRHNSIHRLGSQLPTLAEGLRGAGYATAAFVGALVLDARFGLDRGFDIYDDQTSGRVSGSTGYAERRADAVVDAALAWLDSAPDRFFLWVHFYDAHAAYAPPPGFASAFPGEPYAGEIAFVDAEIGRLLSAIDTRFGSRGLLVVATADHGESLGEHGEPAHSHTLYEATQRIPLLLAGAGLPAGHVAPGPASLIDIAPTLLAWVGAPPLPTARGSDLRIVMRGAQLAERPIYMETLATQFDFGWSPLLALRVGRFKFVRAPRPELYDLISDPDETRNLAGEQPERLARMDAQLDAWSQATLASTSASVPAGDRARLRSLGYVVPEDVSPEISWGRVGGPDPKDRIGLLDELAHAQEEIQTGRPAEALARLDALTEGGAHVVLLRAAAALASGDARRAEREAQAVLDAEPARTDARILVARALDAQGQVDASDRVLAGLPSEVAPAPWVALRAARAELAAGETVSAARRLAFARGRHPDDPRLALRHAHALEALGRAEQALSAREAAHAAAPDAVAPANDLAWSLASLGRDLDRALALAQTAVERGGDDPALLDTLVTVQLARGDAAAARATLARALPVARGTTREHLLELERRLQHVETP